jgi:DNA repair exonuclease SbcCD nuclease subunit
MKPMEEQDVALKILHTADWHLGRSFPAFAEEDQRKLTLARSDAVGKILGVAESYAVQAVLCAGDLFDDPLPSDAWWRELLHLFERRNWKNRLVFLLPGNHDPLWPNSVWAADHPFRRGLPAWVHVVDRDDFEFQLSDEAVLYASPCRSKAGADDLALRLPNRQPGDKRIRIGLAHGQSFDMPGHQTNFPIASDAAQQRGLNYLALGDNHGYKELPPKTCPAVYPGTPEADTFQKTDGGVVAVVFFSRQGIPTIQKEKVGRWHWKEVCCRSLDELEQLRKEDLKDCVLRLTFAMEVNLRERERVDSIIQELKGTEAAHAKIGVLHCDVSGLEMAASGADFDAYILPDVLKSVVARLQAQAAERQGDVARRALYHLYKTLRTSGASIRTAQRGANAE